MASLRFRRKITKNEGKVDLDKFDRKEISLHFADELTRLEKEQRASIKETKACFRILKSISQFRYDVAVTLSDNATDALNQLCDEKRKLETEREGLNTAEEKLKKKIRIWNKAKAVLEDRVDELTAINYRKSQENAQVWERILKVLKMHDELLAENKQLRDLNNILLRAVKQKT